MVEVHGLAANIRSATESETFDLGGLSATTIATVVQDAFGAAFSDIADSGMIRITLVVGAGKQARQKYDGQALKTVTSTLQSIGFSEDRGASCVRECAGLYKFQHDTGKNLKTVVVFPKLPVENKKGSSASSMSDSEPSLLQTGSMESKVAVSTLSTFQAMVKARCTTWSQKKALLQFLDDELLARVHECDQLLMKGQPLNEAQQDFYDGCNELTDKRKYLQEALHAHVELGNLTQVELDHLKEQVKHRIAELEEQGKSTIKTKERQVKLQKIEAQPMEPLRHHAALGKLWKQVAPLQHLDEHSGKLLSVQENKLLGQKIDLLAQIAELEAKSQGWLEAEELFQERLERSRREFFSKFGIGAGKSSKSSKGGSGLSVIRNGSQRKATTIGSNTKVRVPASKYMSYGDKKLSNQDKKKARMKKGDLFGAMMAKTGDMDDEDYSSDSDDEAENDTGETSTSELEPDSVTSKVASQTSAKPTNKSKGKKRKKKGKGGKRSKASQILENDDDLVTQKESDKVVTESNGAHTIVTIVSQILSVIIAILMWLVTLLAGKSKKSKNKKP